MGVATKFPLARTASSITQSSYTIKLTEIHIKITAISKSCNLYPEFLTQQEHQKCHQAQGLQRSRNLAPSYLSPPSASYWCFLPHLPTLHSKPTPKFRYSSAKDSKLRDLCSLLPSPTQSHPANPSHRSSRCYTDYCNDIQFQTSQNLLGPLYCCAEQTLPGRFAEFCQSSFLKLLPHLVGASCCLPTFPRRRSLYETGWCICELLIWDLQLPN